jgi:CheY-like chemotaxis protein
MDPSLTILLADDDETEVFLMQRTLHALGLTHPLRVAHDGAEAIEYLAGQGVFADRRAYPVPDCVILDLKMPKVDGFEVLEFIKSHPELAVIPTIVWSGSLDARDVKRAYCLGANGYVTKPNSPEEFRSTLEAVFKYWSVCQVPVADSGPTCAELKKQNPFCGAYSWTKPKK